MTWLYIALICSWLSGILIGYGIAKDVRETPEDRFDMTGFGEREHLVSIAPYEGMR